MHSQLGEVKSKKNQGKFLGISKIQILGKLTLKLSEVL